MPRESVILEAGGTWNYLISVHRAEGGGKYDFWPVSVRSRLPRIGIPLTKGYPDVVLDLQICLDLAYEDGAFERRIDYRAEPLPPLSPEDAAWADALLKSKGLR